MNITIIGTGYVGLVTGACLADLGNHVFCLDVAQAKIDLLNSGGVPIYEPGLKEVIERNVEAGRLPVIPAKAGIQSPIPAPTFSVLSNPEFLKEGAAVEDFTRPDGIVLGVDDTPAGQQALATMRQLYAPFNRNHERTRVMDVKSAEFTKYAANAMLATRISFMNELANLAEQVGADIELVRQGIGSDPRIGYSFLYAGTGYGGSCFPKDVQALIRTGREHGLTLRMLEAVEAVNHDQKQVLVQKVFARYGRDLSGKTFALWGLAFKPNTNDMRDAPSRVVISALLRAGARIQAHDPVAEEEARRVLALDLADAPTLLEKLQFMDKPMEAVQGADALIIVTEWKAYRSPNWPALKTAMKATVIFDGRNLYEPRDIKSQGIEYHGIGRVVEAHR